MSRGQFKSGIWETRRLFAVVWEIGGQAQPHHRRRKNRAERNISVKPMKLRFMMPSAALWMRNAGEK